MENLYYQKCFNDDEVSIWYLFKQVFKYLAYAVVILILVAMLCGINVYVVGGWSMQPTIDYMSLVVVNKNVDKNNLQVGDIVSFKMGQLVNTHRIVEIHYDDENSNVVQYYKTEGDNPNLDVEDPPLYPDKVIGTVVTVFGVPLAIPEVGNIILDIQENLVLSVLLLILVYLFFTRSDPRKYVAYYLE